MQGRFIEKLCIVSAMNNFLQSRLLRFSCAYWRVKLLDPDLDEFLASKNVYGVRAHTTIMHTALHKNPNADWTPASIAASCFLNWLNLRVLPRIPWLVVVYKLPDRLVLLCHAGRFGAKICKDLLVGIAVSNYWLITVFPFSALFPPLPQLWSPLFQITSS